jgi:hypothetical protein
VAGAPQRAAWITTVDDHKVAICMIGSKDNLDEDIQDTHPERVKGWVASTTHDVMRWLRGEMGEWNEARWGESIGSVACKAANYEVAIGKMGFGVKRGNYEKSLVLDLEQAEWLAFVYYIEKEGEHTVVPFDLILIARPIWIRSRMGARTTDRTRRRHRSSVRYSCELLRITVYLGNWEA